MTIDEDGKISIYHPDNTDLSDVSNQHTALTLDRVTKVAEYYGLSNRNTLETTYVKKTDQAYSTDNNNTDNHMGLINLGNGNDTGLTTNALDNGILALTKATDTLIKEEKSERIALHPNNIPMFMHNWGLSDKKWCHEIKKGVIKNAQTNSHGYIAGGVNGKIVLAAYCSNQHDNHSITAISSLYKAGTNSNILCLDYTNRNPIVSTNVGDVTIYYINPIAEEVTESTQSSSPASEEPSFEPEELSPQSDTVTESVLEPSMESQTQHVPFHTEVETTEVVDPLETEDIQDGEIDG